MDASTSVVLAIVIFGPIAALIAFAAFTVWRESRKPESRLGGVRNGSSTYQGVAFTWTYLPASKQGPARIEVDVPATSAGAFTIARETQSDSFFKRIGLSREIQTGDPLFDRDFYIVTQTERFTRTFLSAAERREVVRALIAQGATSVDHDGETMCAVLPGPSGPDGIDVAELRPAVRSLAVLARGVPATLEEQGEGTPALWRLRRVIAFAIPPVAVPAGIVGTRFGPMPLDGLELGVLGAAVGLAVAVLHVGLAALLLRGRSNSHREWKMVATISFVFLPFGLALILPVLNSRLDTGPPTQVEVYAISRHVSGKNNDTYTTVVQSWRGRGTETITDRNLYLTVVPGSSVVRVTTRPGYFGYEWVESASVKPGFRPTPSPVGIPPAPPRPATRY